jgi:ABC-2 type transport system permease protein
MKKALFIMIKEVRDFLRDKGDLSFSLLLPILIFALIYGAFGSTLQFNGTAYVVNEDQGGHYSTLLLKRLDDYTGLTIRQLSASDADSRLSRAGIQLAVYIPVDFSEKLAASQPSQLIFKQRGNGGTEGQIIASLVRGTAEGISQEIEVRNRVQSDLANSGIDSLLIQTTVEQFLSEEKSIPTVSIHEVQVGSSPNPVNQFLPGIITMFVLFAVNLTAQALVDERRKGTLERLLASRLKTGELFAGKFLASMARGFVQTAILLFLAYAVFRIFTPLSFLAALIIALVFASAASAMGLIIGSLSRTPNQATCISVFITMLMVMLSGTFVPVTEGTVLGTLSRFSINTYANDAFRTIISKGGSLGDAQIDIIVMVSVAVIGLIVGRFLFRVTQAGK